MTIVKLKLIALEEMGWQTVWSLTTLVSIDDRFDSAALY